MSYILVNFAAIVQGDKKVSVHLIVTVVTGNVQSVPPPVSRHLLKLDSH
jgi:hypothetical protein